VKFEGLNVRPLRAVLVVTVVLGLAGVGLRPLEAPAWAAVKARQPELEKDTLQDALGQGVTVGLLGGFRAVLADLFWIKTYALWEQSDLPATQTMIRVVTSIDPQPLMFWTNGAGMIAYDMPHWRIRAAGGYQAVPEATQRQFDLEQADLALRLLERAFHYHPNSPTLYTEMAHIHLNRRKDIAAAAEMYRVAAQQKNAPYFAGRIYAELLKRMGKKAEAYAWLRQFYPTLPRPDAPRGATAWVIESAMADVVLERIMELEQELKIEADQRFKP
jgi:tetratricopeptide (TPR) repeat protein